MSSSPINDPVETKTATQNVIGGPQVAATAVAPLPVNEIGGPEAPRSRRLPASIENDEVVIYNHVTGEHLIKPRAAANDYVRCRRNEKERWSFERPVDQRAVAAAVAEFAGRETEAPIEVQKLIQVKLNELRAKARGLGIAVDPLWGMARLRKEIAEKEKPAFEPMKPDAPAAAEDKEPPAPLPPVDEVAKAGDAADEVKAPVAEALVKPSKLSLPAAGAKK